jgi:hypothetical protein
MNIKAWQTAGTMIAFTVAMIESAFSANVSGG